MWHPWLRALLRPDTTQREIDDEVAYHLARDVERRVAHGVAPAEAQVAARRAFGNAGVHREHARDAMGTRLAEHLGQDMRYALRTLRRAPAYTVVVVVSLAIGIGASTAMFSVADSLLFRPLAVEAPERLVTIQQRQADGRLQPNFSFSDFERFRERTGVFSGMAATTWADGFNVAASGLGVDDRQARISVVSGTFFTTLGLHPALGRLLSPVDDEGVGGHPVAVISDSYWTTRFARDPGVVGRTLTLNGTRFDIIGVTPKSFSGDWVGWPTDFWVPVAMLSEVLPGTSRAQRGGFAQFKLLARLAPDVAPRQAEAALAVIHRDIAREHVPGSGVVADARIEVASAARGYSAQRDAFAKPIALLLALVGAVLLVVCGNVAALSLARASARRREIALRLALGASRGRISRQLLTESALVAVAGGALGVALASVTMRLLGELIQSGPKSSVTMGAASVVLDLSLDSRVLLFALVSTALTVVIFGLAPAVRGSRVSLVSAMTVRGATGSAAGVTVRRMLVALQVALSLVLLVGASLFVRTLRNLRHEDIGLAERPHLVMAWTLPGQLGLRGDALRALVTTVNDRLARVPGVAAVSASGSGLLTGSSGGPRLWTETKPSDDGIRVDGSMTVGPSFFSTIRQPLLAGREFDLRDTDTSARVVIVNESLARELFGQAPALGRRVATSRGSTDSYEIVGVVRDARYRDPRQTAGLMTYWPVLNSGRAPRVTFVARVNGDVPMVMSAMRRAIHDASPQLPLVTVNTIDEQLDGLLFRERILADFAAFFGAVALVLASVGVFGVVAYVTARRTGEMAVRLALGAPRTSVVAMILGDSVRVVGVGALIGVPLAVLLHRAAARLTYGIPPGDALAIAVAVAALLAVALVAAFLPARRAATLDPAITLHAE